MAQSPGPVPDKIVVCVVGDKGVGKTTFISNCLGIPMEECCVHRNCNKMEICGMLLNIEIVDDPFPSEFTHAKVIVIMFDVTKRPTFDSFPELLRTANNLAPKAFICVVGNKADLQDEVDVDYKEAQDRCLSLDTHAIYFHLSATDTHVVEQCFWDIISRPLIYKHVCTATQKDAKDFLQIAMTSCLNKACFPLLTHLRSLGYPVNQKVIAQNSVAMAKYLYDTYPPIVVPAFHNVVSQPALYEWDSCDDLYELEQSMEVVDKRPYIELKRTYALKWKDIHLVTFSEVFLTQSSVDVKFLVHIDLSHNKLLRVPNELLTSLPNLESLNVSSNELHDFPIPEVWGRNSKLAILNLSHNKIYKGSFSPGGNQSAAASFVNKQLWYLNISYNSLREFPLWVLQLHGLRCLHLENNKKMSVLPTKLCSLPNINSVHIDGLKLIDPPLNIARLGFQAMKTYMNQQSEASAPWNFLQLIIVGPQDSGKTYLSARLRDVKYEDRGPTKGVQIEEWKFRIREFLTFRRDHFRFDVWDFGGSYPYNKVYRHFPTVSSVHVLVLNIRCSYQDLFEWLIDIQCRKSDLVPVFVVFTHLDTLPVKSEREELCQERLRWIAEHITGKHGATLIRHDYSSFTSSLRTLTDSQRRLDASGYLFSAECTHQTGSAAHLMPAVMGVAFVSNTTGAGIPQLRSRLYKSLTEPISLLNSILGPLGMGISVPVAYSELAQLIYNLRLQSQRSSTRGNEPFLYSVDDLKKRISLQSKKPPTCDLLPVLQFMNQCGLIRLFKTHGESFLVCLNPQLICNAIIARILRIAESDEKSLGFIPTSHFHMIFGDPVGDMSSNNFLRVFDDLNVFVNVEGTVIVPSCVPSLKTLPIDLEDLVWKRSFFLTYFPLSFWSDFATMLLMSLTIQDDDLEYSIPSAASCVFNHNPIILHSGAKLYVWKHSVLLCIDGNTTLYVCLNSCCYEAQEHLHRRIDVRLRGSPEVEANLIAIASSTFNNVLTKKYSGLLRSNIGNSLLDDFIPLHCSYKQQDADHAGQEVPEKNGRKHHMSNSSLKLSRSFPSGLDQQTSILRTQSEAVNTLERNATILQWLRDNNMVFNCSTAILDGVFGPGYIPFSVWECLEIAYHSSVVMHCGVTVSLEKYLPEIFLAFASLPRFHHLASPSGQASWGDSYLLSDKQVQESGGFFLRHFYKPTHKEACLKHSSNHSKMVCLMQCVEEAKEHYLKLKRLQSDYIVSVCGVNVNPPTVALELAPHGSLRSILKNQPSLLSRSSFHCIIIQICGAIKYLMEHGIHYHGLQSENILVWSLDPVVVRLSDAGVMKPHKCAVCAAWQEIPSSSEISTNVLDVFMLGILCYELATGERPYEEIHPLPIVVTGVLQGDLDVNIEAALLLRCKKGSAPSCSKTCLQMFMQACFDVKKSSLIIDTTQLLPKLSLCSGDGCWSPLRTCVNIECIENSTSGGLVHWASGSRGLVVGSLDPVSGKMSSRILQAAPTPTSGMFANRKGKPAPIAVGRASAIAVVKATQQMWIGTENGNMGSVYVFNLPDMDVHYYIHMQDAVLSLLACNDALYKVGASERSKHSVLVGLANGTIQIFSGYSKDGATVCQNPLQSQRQVIAIPNRLSCLSMVLTPSGNIWCACGDTIQILDTSKLEFCDSLLSNQHRNSPVLKHEGMLSSPKSPRRNPHRLSTKDVNNLTKLQGNTKADLIVLLMYGSQGVWSVARRGTSVKLWDVNTNKIKAEFDVKSYFDDDDGDASDDNITALATQGQVVWIGTRAGRLLLLDVSSPRLHKNPPLLGIQQYGKSNGKVKCIVPFWGTNNLSASLTVVCSLEQADEISSILLTWEYQHR